jgi:hypothetical protein
VRIEVTQLPPASASPNSRAHWSKKYKDAQVYSTAVYYEAVAERNKVDEFQPFRHPVVQLTFVFSRKAIRDEDNLRARFKSGQDALVKAEIFNQDDMAHLEVNRPIILVDPQRAPMTVIEIEEK